MAKFSYNSTPENKILVLLDRLNEDAWANVPRLPKIELDSPLLATIKTAVLRDVEALSAALNGVFEGALPADVDWDRAQTQLARKLAAEEVDDDPARVAAAKCLQRDLLSGRGTAQTTLPFDEEVAFGVRQRELAAQEPYKSHIALLGLGSQIERIKQTTEALDAALKAGAAAGATSRSVRVKNALSEVRNTLQWAHRSLAQLAKKAHSKADRERVASLLAPLAKLNT
jgi:hypothetical protein